MENQHHLHNLYDLPVYYDSCSVGGELWPAPSSIHVWRLSPLRALGDGGAHIWNPVTPCSLSGELSDGPQGPSSTTYKHPCSFYFIWSDSTLVELVLMIPSNTRTGSSCCSGTNPVWGEKQEEPGTYSWIQHVSISARRATEPSNGSSSPESEL